MVSPAGSPDGGDNPTAGRTPTGWWAAPAPTRSTRPTAVTSRAARTTTPSTSVAASDPGAPGAERLGGAEALLGDRGGLALGHLRSRLAGALGGLLGARVLGDERLGRLAGQVVRPLVVWRLHEIRARAVELPG